MAQIEQSDGGKKKKGAQKKMHIHVDFTPMVDMNMLLITFFMLCTTMIKSQTLSITLPSNEPTEENEKTEAKESEGITLIVDVARDSQGNAIKDSNGKPVKNVVYYYFGKPWDGVNGPNPVKQEEFIGDENHLQRGIRKILHDRNKEVLRQVEELKTKWKDGGFSKNKAANDSLYQEAAKKVRNDEKLERPVVVIKATPEATWESLISALDEMQINQIARYQIDQITDADKYMMINYLSTHPSK